MSIFSAPKSSNRKNFVATIESGLGLETLEPRMMLSTVQIFAAGGSGQESITLYQGDSQLATFENVGGDASAREYVELTYFTAESFEAGDLSVRFTNDLYDPATGLDRNVFIDRIIVDGVVHETEGPSVYSNGFHTGAGFLENETLTINGGFYFSNDNTPRGAQALYQATFIARGTTGDEQVEISVNGETKTYSLSTFNKQFEFRSTNPFSLGNVQLRFLNDLYDPANGIDRNVVLESMQVEDLNTGLIDFQSLADSSRVYSTGTWLPEDGIVPGFGRGNVLNANGVFTFDGAGGGDDSMLVIRARGTTDGAAFNVQIDGVIQQSFVATTSFQNFVYQHDTPVSADQVRVEFTNDFFDPNDLSRDRNLVVDKLTLDGIVFETEAGSTFSTGTYSEQTQQIAPSFARSEILHINGYFQYDAEVVAPGDVLVRDTSFGNGGQVLINTSGLLAPVSDFDDAGRFVIAERQPGRIRVFNADGTPDSSFGTFGVAPIDSGNFSLANAHFLSDGSVIFRMQVGEGFEVRKLQPNGAVDNSFALDPQVTAVLGGLISLEVDAQDRILLGSNSIADGVRLFRINSNGSIDTSFGGNGLLSIETSRVVHPISQRTFLGLTEVAPDGSFYFLANSNAAGRVNSSGQLDLGFGSNGISRLPTDTGQFWRSARTDSRGRLQANGAFSLIRLTNDGQIDTSFGDGGQANATLPLGSPSIIWYDDQDRIFLADDEFQPRGPYLRTVVVRLDADGIVDSTFGVDGVINYFPGNGVVESDDLATIIVAPDGSFLSQSGPVIRRFTY
ncbi:MAG: carbohydrate-binding domain-containing protein [Mariniblastus sp.]